MRSASLAMGAVLAALGVAGPAAAHVVAQPPYVTAQEVGTISLDSPNEREGRMTEFTVKVPPGVEIVDAHGPEAWQVAVKGSTATWSGGNLAPGATATFGLVLDARTDPGTIRLDADQRYGDGGVVRWPVSLTVLPAKSSPAQNLRLAAVVGLIGVLVIAAMGALALRTRARLH